MHIHIYYGMFIHVHVFIMNWGYMCHEPHTMMMIYTYISIGRFLIYSHVLIVVLVLIMVLVGDHHYTVVLPHMHSPFVIITCTCIKIWYIYIYTCHQVPCGPFDVGNSIFKPYKVLDNYIQSCTAQQCII